MPINVLNQGMWRGGISDPILLDACILDYALTKEAEFVESAATADAPLKRVNDGLMMHFSFDDRTPVSENALIAEKDFSDMPKLGLKWD